MKRNNHLLLKEELDMARIVDVTAREILDSRGKDRKSVV
jgi:hypothetical protein